MHNEYHNESHKQSHKQSHKEYHNEFIESLIKSFITSFIKSIIESLIETFDKLGRCYRSQKYKVFKIVSKTGLNAQNWPKCTKLASLFLTLTNLAMKNSKST